MSMKKSPVSKKIKKIVKKFENVLKENLKQGKILCILCDCFISIITVQACKRHLNTEKHIKNQKLKYYEEKDRTDKRHLWGRAFGETGIAINNVRKPAFREPMTEIDPNLPSVSTTRKVVFEQFNKDFKSVVTSLFNKEIYLLCDETQKYGVKYFLVIAGLIEKPKAQFLIYLKVGNFKCNNVTVLNFLNDALKGIFSNFNKVKLIVTDAVSYNLTAKSNLLKNFSHIKWVTCYSHSYTIAVQE